MGLAGSWSAAALLLALCAAPGCATKEQWIQRRPLDQPLAARIFSGEPDPVQFSAATQQVATQSGLNPDEHSDRERLLAILDAAHAQQQSPQVEFALSEVAGVHADELRDAGDEASLGFYAESLVHGYHALAGDPNRRIGGATARYNNSLRSVLRLLKEQDAVRPGATIPLPSSDVACSIAVELHSSRWSREDFHDFEFAGDYQVLGLRNHYHTTGVGVPLVAMRLHPDRDHPEDRFYPQKLCYPLTAFARVEQAHPHHVAQDGHPPHTERLRLVLELHDPMEHEQLTLAGRSVPMASDLTTPLAYFLDQPEFHDEGVSTNGLFMPESVEPYRGLYLLEPYDPHRMPVVMVHGLWSSPATWMEMFNDLRSDPRVRSRYQFWFYLYPTGKPFFVSGANMRSDLAALRQSFDPGRTALPLDQTVLVGHSMGGLLSRLQAVDSGDDFWSVVANEEFSRLVADDETKRAVSQMFYFRPNKSVRRVVTIGSPHRGSRFANGVTRWLGTKLIAFPVNSMARRQQLFRDNPGLFRPAAASMMTSIDSLAPDSPMLGALLNAKSAPWVSYHNVVGDKPRDGMSAWFSSRGDGVVSLGSARLDDLPRLESQVIVPEAHVALHRHPQTVAEVQRVLLAQAVELEGIAVHSTSTRLPIATPGIQLISGESSTAPHSHVVTP